jgi:hypothetical protein
VSWWCWGDLREHLKNGINLREQTTGGAMIQKRPTRSKIQTETIDDDGIIE